MDHGFESIRVKLASLIALGALTGVPMIPASRRCANAASRFIRRFEPSGGLRGGVPEHHVGRINKVGVDLGWEKGGTLIWDVRSPALASGPGALSGNYIGASADVVAGSRCWSGNKMVLNPISVSGDIGINLAAGIADLDLNYAG
jgi:hypothetical protein